MFRNADRIVAVCQWLHDALAANGVPPEKLVLNRQGVTTAFLETAAKVPSAPRCHGKGPLKLLYVGRLHPVKGIDVVVRAVRALPKEASVQLSIHGLPGESRGGRLRAPRPQAHRGDPRIAFAAPWRGARCRGDGSA